MQGLEEGINSISGVAREDRFRSSLCVVQSTLRPKLEMDGAFAWLRGTKRAAFPDSRDIIRIRERQNI